MKILTQLVLIPLLVFTLIPALNAQYCQPIESEEKEFEVTNKFVKVDAEWYPGWIEYNHGKEVYPEALSPLQKWKHPYMKEGLPSAMHEDSYASDVSNMQGPVPENPTVQYFHVQEKGKEFSGMCPSFAFIDDNTMVTISFGRAHSTLLLIDIEDTLKLIDALPIPGRGNSAMELATKKARMALFRDTSGGAYFFLSKQNEVIIPGPDYQITYVPIEENRFSRSKMLSYNIKEEIRAGDLYDEGIDAKSGRNKLTAVMPDANGNVWYTSKLGIVGIIDRKSNQEVQGDCPKTYSHFISEYGLLKKIEHFFGKKYENLKDLEFYREGMSDTEYRKEFRKFFMIDPDSREEIQNSFAVGDDGVYIVSNIALYKLRFNEETKTIEMDPKWEKTFNETGDQIYYNDFIQKKGQLNNGSGTTPTLMDDRFVIIADNDYHQINLTIYSQEDGHLVSRHKLFRYDSSACENSVVAYKNSLFIGNTFNYIDPFKENDTAGGINRFDYNEETGEFELNEDWPAEFIDAQTATPKMSTAIGALYVYNREESDDDGYADWQLTTIDFETGRKVFYIRPYFKKSDFSDNISFLIKAFAMGNKNYYQKVFNNIWATYTFGPNNSIYIGAFRGFLKFSSDPKPINTAMK